MIARIVIGSALAALVACGGEPTQLVVVVETNLDVPAEIDGLTVVVRGPSSDRSESEMLLSPEDPPFPRTLTVLPAGEVLGQVRVEAIGRLDGAEVVRAVVETTLVEGESRMVRLALVRSCIDRSCGDGMTCGEEGCAPVDIAFEDLPEWTGAPPPFDGTGECLVNRWDLDGDGHGATECGGDDCDDDEPRSYPGNVEECDGVDNDCDGAPDEECSCTPEGVVEDCNTRCGTTGSHRCNGGIWTTCIAEEVCSASDTDCDGATDEGFEYVARAPRPITNTTVSSDEPFLLYENDRFNVTWVEADDGSVRNAYFATLDVDGNLSGRSTTMIIPDAREPRLAFSGSRFGVAWWDPDLRSCGGCGATDFKVGFRTMDLNGGDLSAAVTLNGNARDPVTPRIVWTGSEFGIAHHDRTIYLHRADERGARVTTNVEVEPSGGGLDMLHDGSTYAFLFSDSQEVRFNAGTPLAFLSPSPLVYVGGNDVRHVDFTATETGFFAAWSANDGREVETALLDDGGALSRGSVTRRSVPMMRARNQIRPQVEAASGQVFLVFRAEVESREEDLYFARYAHDGRELQPPTRISAPGDQFYPSIDWAEDRLGVVYVDDSGADDQLHFTALSCP